MPAAVHRCRPCDPETGAAFGDQLEITVVELPKFPEALPEGLGMVEVQKAARTLEYISADPVERAPYEAREKQRRDIASLIHEGREDGRRQGQLVGTAQTLMEVLGRPSKPAEAWAAMTEAELTALVAELRAGRPPSSMPLSAWESSAADPENPD